MKKISSAVFSLLVMTSFTFISCNNKSGSNATESDSTTVENPEEQPKELVADVALNRAAMFYAGISRDGIEMNQADASAWDNYSKTIGQLIKQSEKTINGVDSIARNDFKDFRDKINYVFYPLSAADFMYPITLYPDADCYFLCGLEKAGTIMATDVKTNFSHYEAHRKALYTFFRSSFFITKNMADDFDNNELDGVCSVITMLMAIKHYDIISIKYMQVDNEGVMVEAQNKSNILEYKFFKKGSSHEQTLYYYAGDVSNEFVQDDFKRYLDFALPQFTVGTYLKAGSFLLHKEHFSILRNYILDNSLTIVEDDSGIPYRMLKDNFNITLYGKYIFPSTAFDKDKRQYDLDKLYKDGSLEIHPLPFRIGYNNPSNWLCARKKVVK